MRRLTVLAALAGLLFTGVATPAGAQQDAPFGPGDSPLVPAPEQPAPAPAPAEPLEPDDGGLEGWQAGLLLGAAVVLLGGIAFAIVRDARQAAPVEGDGGPRADEERAERERRRKRSSARRKGKAARSARRRNR
ncbi:MAG TPA: hypothetical protein VGW11_02950 [Solirubrobacteraceae bacterium]|nr:hypothetical protein [Solirubrobacteraceae bacterium]